MNEIRTLMLNVAMSGKNIFHMKENLFTLCKCACNIRHRVSFYIEKFYRHFKLFLHNISLITYRKTIFTMLKTKIIFIELNEITVIIIWQCQIYNSQSN